MGIRTEINKKQFYRQVAALVVPIALQNLINVGVQSADVIMLGRVGEIVLSGASLAGQVQFVLMLLFFGLASGGSVLTAQYWGKGDRRTIEKVLAITLKISMAASFVFFFAAFFFPEVLMRIFTPEAEVIAAGVVYLRIIAPSYLFMGFTNIYLNIMRSVERVVVATAVYFISFVTNVVLNALLIFGLLGFPAMGIAGAALGSTLARALELVIVIVYAARNPDIRLRPKDYTRRHRALFKDFFKYSMPTTVNELLWGMAMSANAVIIGHMGAAAVAANSVTNVTRQLATVVCFGLASATAILLGKTIGAGETAKADVFAKLLVRITMIAGVAGGGLILVIRPLVLHIMNLSAAAQDYLSFMLYFLCIYVVASAFNTVIIVGVLRAGGDTRFGLYVDMTTMWGGSILLGALAAFVFGFPVKAVLLILYCDEFLKLIPCFLRYRGKKWLRNVTRPQMEEP
ncbi:MATE family efflux transporter [Ruminococcaceae bacterium OttesenSCG-928-I18]|nr:MATE family efflux transporter [Ruminococcaceae bacterium OttesenSCG-928-I18]